jgi:hypothetical protein
VTEVLIVRGVGFSEEFGELDGEEGGTTVVVLDGEQGRTTMSFSMEWNTCRPTKDKTP